MKKARILLLLLMVPVILQVSCKKDDPPAPPVYKEPTAASMADVAAVPAGLAAKADAGTDFGAVYAAMYMELANGISGFGGLFAVPDGASVQSKKSGSTVWFWSYGGYSYWMTYEELATKYVWKYEYQFPDVPRFTYIAAEEAKDGKSGNWTIYDPAASGNSVWTYIWNINSSNTFTADLTWDEGNSPSAFKVVANANNSGNFKYYASGVLECEIVWNSDGSGSYTFYGDMASYSGTWTAK